MASRWPGLRSLRATGATLILALQLIMDCDTHLTVVACNVVCGSAVFSDNLPALHATHAGSGVCENHGCGVSAPFVGIDDFHCSADETAWRDSSRCCNTTTCAPVPARLRPTDGGAATSTADPSKQSNCPGPTGTRLVGTCTQQQLARRSDQVTLACCDQPGSCIGGRPVYCTAECAKLLLPFWDDCAALLLTSDRGELFIETIVQCRAASHTEALADSPRSTQYAVDIQYQGRSFGEEWNFFTDPDPTGGCVRFVDREEAVANGLFGFDEADGTFKIRADTSQVVSSCDGATGGRPAVRIASKKRWHSGGLFSIDLAHMPSGCGTWPAFWLVAAPCGEQRSCQWPVGGEIDIIEGANLNTRVATTLHTTGDCDMNPLCPDYPDMTGDFGAFLTCDGAANGNMGCGINGPEGTYGEALNAQGGGVFVAEWLDRQISVWFFRHGQEPRDLLDGTPQPSDWGTPYASFPLGANCASSHFQDLQIVFDLTFCGGYAGNTYDDTCGDEPDSCRTASSTSTLDRECYAAIVAARANPNALEYGGCITTSSTDAEVQAVLFSTRLGKCVRPCVDMRSVCIPGVDTADNVAAPSCGPPSAACSANIDWAISSGLIDHPEWYANSGLTPSSPRSAMQAWLFQFESTECQLPCDILSLNLSFDAESFRDVTSAASLVSPSGVNLLPPSGPVLRCNERVLWQPESFAEAFWAINAVTVFQQQDNEGRTCEDGRRNGETGLDCGGPCHACGPSGH
eukprot:COSAG02_NODE_280_length_25797_cov_66.644447_13_plen_744_part_00